MRPGLLSQGHRAGKHVYCEKPVATNLAEALDICRKLAQAGHQARRGAGQAVPARPAAS
jgi:predicted dehydrogenase